MYPTQYVCYSYYVFREDPLVLYKQLVCSFLGKTTFSAPSFPYMPLALCVVSRPCGFLSPTLICLLFSTLSSCLDNCVGDILCMYTLKLLEYTVSEQLHVFLSFIIIPTFYALILSHNCGSGF